MILSRSPRRLSGSFYSPREVGERLVGVGHLVRGLARGDGLAFTLGGVEEFLRQPLGHRLALFFAGGGDDPAETKALLAAIGHLHRHLVVGAADTLGAHLDIGSRVGERLMKNLERGRRKALDLFLFET